jgi:SAM-dependent methyltransferase
MLSKQVDKSHYCFDNYISKKRWISLWHQLDEVLSLQPENVLEVGPGPGMFKKMAAVFGLTVKTIDVDPDLAPDYVASVTNLPFQDHDFDCVCAFQVLEHLPYAQALEAFEEMVRVSKKNIVISLPDAKKLYYYHFTIPKIGTKQVFLPRPPLKPVLHHFDGQHYWEINKKGYVLKDIIADFCSHNVELIKTYRVKEYLYHRFFVFEKQRNQS